MSATFSNSSSNNTGELIDSVLNQSSGELQSIAMKLFEKNTPDLCRELDEQDRLSASSSSSASKRARISKKEFIDFIKKFDSVGGGGHNDHNDQQLPIQTIVVSQPKYDEEAVLSDNCVKHIVDDYYQSQSPMVIDINNNNNHCGHSRQSNDFYDKLFDKIYDDYNHNYNYCYGNRIVTIPNNFGHNYCDHSHNLDHYQQQQQPNQRQRKSSCCETIRTESEITTNSEIDYDEDYSEMMSDINDGQSTTTNDSFDLPEFGDNKCDKSDKSKRSKCQKIAQNRSAKRKHCDRQAFVVDRRERNRLAAQKLRRKRAEEKKLIETQIHRLVNENSNIRMTVGRLETQIDEYRRMLKSKLGIRY